MRIIDLSHPIRPTHWRWPVKIEHSSSQARGDPFQSSVITLSVHAFTHVDAPRHLLPDGLTIDQLPLEIWGGEAVVVDVSHIGPREGITAMVLMEVGAKIHPGDIVLLRTSWDQRYNIASREFWTESPYLSEDGAEWLRSRGIRALGSDFPTDDALKADLANPSRQRHASDYVSHHVLLRNGIYLIEYLANLYRLQRERVLFFALPLNIEGSDGSPCRAVALEFESG